MRSHWKRSWIGYAKKSVLGHLALLDVQFRTAMDRLESQDLKLQVEQLMEEAHRLKELLDVEEFAAVDETSTVGKKDETIAFRSPRGQYASRKFNIVPFGLKMKEVDRYIKHKIRLQYEELQHAIDNANDLLRQRSHWEAKVALLDGWVRSKEAEEAAASEALTESTLEESSTVDASILGEWNDTRRDDTARFNRESIESSTQEASEPTDRIEKADPVSGVSDNQDWPKTSEVAGASEVEDWAETRETTGASEVENWSETSEEKFASEKDDLSEASERTVASETADLPEAPGVTDRSDISNELEQRDTAAEYESEMPEQLEAMDSADKEALRPMSAEYGTSEEAAAFDSVDVPEMESAPEISSVTEQPTVTEQASYMEQSAFTEQPAYMEQAAFTEPSDTVGTSDTIRASGETEAMGHSDPSYFPEMTELPDMSEPVQQVADEDRRPPSRRGFGQVLAFPRRVAMGANRDEMADNLKAAGQDGNDAASPNANDEAADDTVGNSGQAIGSASRFTGVEAGQATGSALQGTQIAAQSVRETSQEAGERSLPVHEAVQGLQDDLREANESGPQRRNDEFEPAASEAALPGADEDSMRETDANGEVQHKAQSVSAVYKPKAVGMGFWEDADDYLEQVLQEPPHASASMEAAAARPAAESPYTGNPAGRTYANPAGRSHSAASSAPETRTIPAAKQSRTGPAAEEQTGQTARAPSVEGSAGGPAREAAGHSAAEQAGGAQDRRVVDADSAEGSGGGEDRAGRNPGDGRGRQDADESRAQRSAEAPAVSSRQQGRPKESGAGSVALTEEILNLRRRYIVGKLAGEDLTDHTGALIVGKGQPITASVMEMADHEGKLAELIINMMIPGLGE